MQENFIYAKQKKLFEEALNNNEIIDEAIVFIEDTKEIWNHGTYFDCNPNHATQSELQSEIQENLQNAISLKADTNDRNNNTAPSDYLQKFKISGIKTCGAIGLNKYTHGDYASLLGIHPWNEQSGISSHELAFAGNGQIMHRHGTSSWGAWKKLIESTDLATVATSGNYNDLSNKPTIPATVTESTVSGWGFTKNTGTYSKPSNGIPKSDLSQEVQQLLNTPSVISQVLQLTTNTIYPIYNTVFKGSDDVYYLDYDSFKQFIELGKHKHFTLLLDSPTSIKSPSSLQILWESGKCPNFYQNDASNPGIHELTFNNYGDDVFYVSWKKHTLGVDTEIYIDESNLLIVGDEIKVKNYGNAVISDKLAYVDKDAMIIKVTNISVSNDSATIEGDNLIIH